MKSEQVRNENLKDKLAAMEIPKEVQGIHMTQEEISTLRAILTLREKQWGQIKEIMESQRQKQKGEPD